MEEFRYKQYTEEESAVYNQTMKTILEGLEGGLSFRAACDAAVVNDAQLRTFIEDDALKIVIADMHYTKGVPLEDIAVHLNVPLDVLNKANAEMLEDVAISSAEAYRAHHPNGPVGSA